jgi:hypothetical protein
VSGPTVRLTTSRVPEVGAVVAEQARSLSGALGHREQGTGQPGQRRREEGAA